MDNKTELTTIIHGQYRVKDEDGKYDLVLYPENDTNDIVIGSLVIDVVLYKTDGKEKLIGNYNTLSDVLVDIIEKLNNCAPENVTGIAEDLEEEDKVYEVGQFIYEKDTNKLRCGDGTSKYSDLPYLQIIPNPE